MSTIKIPTQITKEMLEEYVSDYDRTNMPERMYEFALSYMLEDLAEQAAQANEVSASDAMPEMSEDEDEDIVSCREQEIEYDVKLMQKLM